MSSDLDLLVDFYQWEKQRLLLEIDENKRDHDYIAVHYNYKELGRIQRELDCLLTLKNPDYPKIKKLEKEIDFYSERDWPHPKMAEYYATKVKAFRKELEKLKSKQEFICSDETQILDDALFSLVNDEIQGFSIFDEIEMHFKMDISKNQVGEIRLDLKVGERASAEHLKKYRLSDVPKLIYDESSKSFIANFKVDRFKNVLPIKQTISKIVIATNQYYSLGNTIYLKLHA